MLVDLVLPILAGAPGSRADIAAAAVAVYGNLIALWGVAKLHRDAEAVQPVLADLTEGALTDGRPFQAMGNVVAPMLIMTGVSVVYSVGAAPSFGPLAIVAMAIGFVAWLPLTTLAWVAGSILLGLHRLGGMPLKLKPFEIDRSLGLRKLGALAFTPLLLYAAGTIPAVFLRGPTQIEDAIINIGVLFVIVVLLFASLVRLRRQLIAAKAQHLAWAHELYALALAPVRSAASGETLGAQAAVLQAAESLERRAAVIQEWPFDEGILRGIVAIVTSVSTALVVRLILSRLGL
jgi:hypothetical protein